MRTPGPTSPLSLHGSFRTRWAPPAGRCRLLGHPQAARRRVARPCRGAPDVSSRHALLRLSPRSSDLLLFQGYLSFPFVTPFSGPNKRAFTSRGTNRGQECRRFVMLTPRDSEPNCLSAWRADIVQLWPPTRAQVWLAPSGSDILARAHGWRGRVSTNADSPEPGSQLAAQRRELCEEPANG